MPDHIVVETTLARCDCCQCCWFLVVFINDTGVSGGKFRVNIKWGGNDHAMGEIDETAYDCEDAVPCRGSVFFPYIDETGYTLPAITDATGTCTGLTVPMTYLGDDPFSLYAFSVTRVCEGEINTEEIVAGCAGMGGAVRILRVCRTPDGAAVEEVVWTGRYGAPPETITTFANTCCDTVPPTGCCGDGSRPPEVLSCVSYGSLLPTYPDATDPSPPFDLVYDRDTTIGAGPGGDGRYIHPWVGHLNDVDGHDWTVLFFCVYYLNPTPHYTFAFRVYRDTSLADIRADTDGSLTVAGGPVVDEAISADCAPGSLTAAITSTGSNWTVEVTG